MTTIPIGIDINNPRSKELYRRLLEADFNFQSALEEAYGAEAGTWRYRTKSLVGDCKEACRQYHAAADAFWAGVR